MPDEVSTTTTEAIKKTSDGMVKVSLEKFEEMLETLASQKGTISSLRNSLNQARNEPPVVYRTVVNKTAEILAKEHRAWGGTLMGLGAASFLVGAFRYKAGRTES